MKILLAAVTALIIAAAVTWYVFLPKSSEHANNQAGSLPKLNITEPIRVGVFPRRSFSVTKKAFTPLVKHLSRELGTEVKLVLFKDFKNFWDRLSNKEFDLVHLNQYHYVKAHKEIGYNVILANEEFGRRDIAGSISVRTDSGINSLQDLKGKVISFGGGPKAMVSYIAPTNLLKQAGLEAGKDYTVNFAISPPKAVINTFSKVSDASGSGDIVLNLKVVTKKVDTKKIKILSSSDRIIHIPWAVVDTMRPEVKERIQSVMTNLKSTEEGRKVLKAARVTDFFAVEDKDFDKVREMVKNTINESYFPL